jgi:hypothetical protein
MKLRTNSIGKGIVIASIALAAVVSGCKPDPEPKRECVEPKKGKMVECPLGMTLARDEIKCVGNDGSVELKTGKRFPPGRIPTSFEFVLTGLEMVGPDLASIEMTEPLSKVKGHTKVYVCKE